MLAQDPRSMSTEAWLQEQPREQPCPFKLPTASSPGSRLSHRQLSSSTSLEAGFVAPGFPVAPMVQAKGWCIPAVCGRSARLASVTRLSTCSARGGETLSWAPEGCVSNAQVFRLLLPVGISPDALPVAGGSGQGLLWGWGWGPGWGGPKHEGWQPSSG